MKSILRTIIFVLITILLSTSAVVAHEKDPPHNPHINPNQGEPMWSETLPTDGAPPLIQEKAGSVDQSVFQSSLRTVTPDSGVFQIDAGNSSVTAHGGGYYAVVSIKDGTLRITTIPEGQNLKKFFNISEHASNPDIAYEASTGLFIVVWQYDYYGDGTDYDIFAQAFHPFSGITGVAKPVSLYAQNETDPSVDCNPIDSSCLVAYQYDDSSNEIIYGRFMDMTSSGLSTTSPGTFPISSVSHDSHPLVAFGDLSYLVTYKRTNSSNVDWPIYSHVYPTYQSSGNQTMHGPAYLINPSDPDDAILDDHDKYATGVAFDSCARHFLVTFTYDFSGEGSDLDVGARAVHQINASVGDVFWIAKSIYIESDVDISFIKDYHLTGSPPQASKFVVAYGWRWGTIQKVMATDLLSNCSHSSPSYRVDPWSEHTPVTSTNSYPIFIVEQPSITGAGSYEKFLVTWTKKILSGFTNEDNIFGRLMDASEKIFMPMIQK